MNIFSSLYHQGLFRLRTAYQICSRHFIRRPKPVNPELNDEERASSLIYQALTSDRPCMVARFGSNELAAVVNWQSIQQGRHSVWRFIRGEDPAWWWVPKVKKLMADNAGFFPATEERLGRFAEMMLDDMTLVDVLGSWTPDEHSVAARLEHAAKVRLLLLEPYWTADPWSRALEGKRVLVVHPFAEDIVHQYTHNRERLFRDPRVLPKFGSLRVVKAVQSIGGGRTTDFSDWFEALDWMKQQMDSEPYDIALIGCGAYGFPLAAHAKRTGHKAVHLGGALQLLFGIKGKRWEERAPSDHDYNALFNEYWVKPSASTRNDFTAKVEDGCYW